MVWEGRYKAWGKFFKLTETPLKSETKISQKLRFAGQYSDSETGLFYNRYRYYNPETGRYVSQDPIGIVGGLNAYAYAPNPTVWLDPLGLSKTVCTKQPSCDPCADLPKYILDTFSGGYVRGRRLITDEKFYKYHGESNRVGKKYTWLTNKNYRTETGLRRSLAIRKDWGVHITKLTEFRVPAGTWVCEGKAAAQGYGYPGKGYQAVVTNIPRGWVVRTDGAY